MSRRPALAGLLFLAIGFAGCSTSPEEDWPPNKPGPKVMTSFVPIYCFAANVAGDDASVACLLEGTGPHSYEATGRDSRRLQKADLFFINGLELDEGFSGKIKDSCGNPNLEMIELGEKLEKKDQLLKMKISPAHAGHGHGEHDPHVWLGIPEAITMVEIIRDELIKKDPSHKDGYTQRAADYVKTLKSIQDYGEKQLANKKDRNLISFHESLGYFARTFKLNVVDSLEPIAGTEPDGKRIADLAKKCQDPKDPVRLIAVEPQYPQNTSASTLLRELQAKGVKDADLVVIDPIETVTPTERSKDYYEKKMRENIDRLAEKMK